MYKWFKTLVLSGLWSDREKLNVKLHTPSKWWSLDLTVNYGHCLISPELRGSSAPSNLASARPCWTSTLRERLSVRLSVYLYFINRLVGKKKKRSFWPGTLLFSLSERGGPDKDGQLSDSITWEQSSPGQCFGPLIQRPTRNLRTAFAWKFLFLRPGRGIMLSKDLPDIEVNSHMRIRFFWFLFRFLSAEFSICCPH